MTTLFFFGTLRDRTMLEIVLGRAIDAADIRDAEAPGFSARAFAEEAYPHLAPDPGGRARGCVVSNLSAADLARLEFFEEDEYGLAPITVETAGGLCEARYFRSTDRLSATEAAWDLEEWRRRDAAVAIEATRELMAHFGQIPVEDVDRIWSGIMIRARMRARAKAETPVAGALRRHRSPDDVVGAEIRRPYTGFFAVEEHRLRHRLFGGGLSATIERTVLSSGDAVTVLPYDPATDQVMLIEQFRAPMHARGDTCPWAIEVIAGRLDKEIEGEVCARREAEEEGGITLGRVELISHFYSSPGVLAERITAYVGEARLEGAGGVFGLANEHEDIRAFTTTLDAALAAVATGEINNGPAMVSLLWLDRNRARLRAAWRR